MIGAFVLKILACATMLTDHLAIALYGNGSISVELYEILRCIGRIAFPIFCFQVVEGAKYTRNRLFYAMRLLFAALISEVPFDMLFSRCFWQPATMNVLFTLLLGLFPVWLLPKALAAPKKKRFWGILLYLMLLFLETLVAEICGTDYGAGGVLAIAIIGLLNLPLTGLRERIPDERILRVLLCALAILVLVLFSVKIEMYAWFSLIPILFYNGRKETGSKAVQYGFYLFYPVHLLILALIFTVPKFMAG